jgi:hypothetical protein
MAENWDAREEPDEVEIGPGDPDYDLSEAHGYSWEPERGFWPSPAWLIAVVSVLLVVALVLPGILLILYRS